MGGGLPVVGYWVVVGIAQAVDNSKMAVVWVGRDSIAIVDFVVQVSALVVVQLVVQLVVQVFVRSVVSVVV